MFTSNTEPALSCSIRKIGHNPVDTMASNNVKGFPNTPTNTYYIKSRLDYPYMGTFIHTQVNIVTMHNLCSVEN